MNAMRSEASEDRATPRRPLVPSPERNNAGPAAGRRRDQVPSTSTCKPVVAAPPPAAASPARRRCTSPSPRRASAVDGAAPPPPSSRARSADRTRPPSAAAAAAAARSASPARGAGADERHAAPRRVAAGAKAPDGLWASARSPSPSPPLQPEPPAPVPAPATVIDRLVRGLPSQPSRAQAGSAAERKRSPLRRNDCIGNQLANARPSDNSNTAKRVVVVIDVEQHRWPAMTTTGRGSAGLTSTSSIALSNPSGGRSPRRARRPSERAAARLSNRPQNETAKTPAAPHRRRREDTADSGSDGNASSLTSQSSPPVPPMLHRSASSPSSRVLSAAASSGSMASSRHSARAGRRPRGCSCSTAQTSGVARPVLLDCTHDARKGRRKNASQVEDIHQLRLLNNRYLQWRFVNARSEAALSAQRRRVESTLYSVSKSILKMWEAVTMTSNTDMQRLQQKLKLYNILKQQIAYLELWPALEEESSRTLLEAIEALKASTLRLPVTSGAQVSDEQAETVAVKNELSSAIDVMQALTSSTCYLQPKVEDTVSLVSELSVTARQEKVALDDCRELIATAGKLQVQEASLCTHLMQLRDRAHRGSTG